MKTCHIKVYILSGNNFNIIHESLETMIYYLGKILKTDKTE